MKISNRQERRGTNHQWKNYSKGDGGGSGEQDGSDLRVLARKPDDLVPWLDPWDHEGKERTGPWKLSSHLHWCPPPPPHTTINKCNEEKCCKFLLSSFIQPAIHDVLLNHHYKYIYCYSIVKAVGC